MFALADHDVKKQEEYVELKDVFAVKVKRRRSAGQQTGGTLLGITLFKCKKKGVKLKEHAIHLNNLSADHCEIWFKSLKEILSGTFTRQSCSTSIHWNNKVTNQTLGILEWILWHANINLVNICSNFIVFADIYWIMLAQPSNESDTITLYLNECSILSVLLMQEC